MAVRTGKGGLIEYSTDGDTYTAIPQVASFKPPEEKQDSEEIHLLDASSPYAEKVPTGLSCGDITATVAYDPANSVHQDLDDLAATELDADEPIYVRITMPGNQSRTYRCVGMSRNPSEVSRREILKQEYTFITVCPVAASSSA